MFPDFENDSLLESLRESDYDTEKVVDKLLAEDENAQKGFCILVLLLSYFKISRNGSILTDSLFICYTCIYGRTKYTGETSGSVQQACQ